MLFKVLVCVALVMSLNAVPAKRAAEELDMDRWVSFLDIALSRYPVLTFN